MGGGCLASFTLAEVLIVLGIIGLIADMTIPTLHQNISEKVTVVQLKKAYSTFEQAFKLAEIENGKFEDWERKSTYGETSMVFLNKIAPFLKTTKVCGLDSGCFPDVQYKLLSGVNDLPEYYFDKSNEWARLQLADGSLVAIWSHKDVPAFHFLIDINGYKKPNQYGIDTFWFFGNTENIVPLGTANEGSFDTACVDKNGSAAHQLGRGCAAWVIYNENMDYLHCDDLSWDGKKKCK